MGLTPQYVKMQMILIMRNMNIARLLHFDKLLISNQTK